MPIPGHDLVASAGKQGEGPHEKGPAEERSPSACGAQGMPDSGRSGSRGLSVDPDGLLPEVACAQAKLVQVDPLIWHDLHLSPPALDPPHVPRAKAAIAVIHEHGSSVPTTGQRNRMWTFQMTTDQ